MPDPVEVDSQVREVTVNPECPIHGTPVQHGADPLDIPVAKRHTRVPKCPPTLNDKIGEWPTSVDISTREGQAFMVRCQGAPDAKVMQVVKVTLQIVAYAMIPREEANEQTGELEQFCQLSLLCADGRLVNTSGGAAIRQWLMAMRFCGVPSLDNPIPIAFREVRDAGTGRTHHELDLVPPF